MTVGEMKEKDRAMKIKTEILKMKDFSAQDRKVLKPISELFSAMSAIDHEKMKSLVTDDFLLMEHGEVWRIDELIEVVNPSEYMRVNYFSIVSISCRDQVAWINYWNKAIFELKLDSMTSDENKPSVGRKAIWLESAVVTKTDTDWKLSQMHSTRVEWNSAPKNIDFIPQ